MIRPLEMALTLRTLLAAAGNNVASLSVDSTHCTVSRGCADVATDPPTPPRHLFPSRHRVVARLRSETRGTHHLTSRYLMSFDNRLVFHAQLVSIGHRRPAAGDVRLNSPCSHIRRLHLYTNIYSTLDYNYTLSLCFCQGHSR